MFNKDSEGFKIGVNERTPGYRGGNSALHLAVLSNGPIEAKKEIVTLFLTQTKLLTSKTVGNSKLW